MEMLVGLPILMDCKHVREQSNYMIFMFEFDIILELDFCQDKG